MINSSFYAYSFIQRASVLVDVRQAIIMSMETGAFACGFIPQAPVLMRTLQTFQTAIISGGCTRAFIPRVTILVQVLQALELSTSSGGLTYVFMPPFRSTALVQTPEFFEVTGFRRFAGELKHGHGTCLRSIFVRNVRSRRAIDRVYCVHARIRVPMRVYGLASRRDWSGECARAKVRFPSSIKVAHRERTFTSAAAVNGP